jgi:hypothetical protein
VWVNGDCAFMAKPSAYALQPGNTELVSFGWATALPLRQRNPAIAMLMDGLMVLYRLALTFSVHFRPEILYNGIRTNAPTCCRGRKMRYAVAILLALTMPASAQDTTTANQMLPGCKGLLDNSMTSGVSVYQQGRCGGYVASLVYGVGGQEFCSPQWVTPGQAVAVVIKYISRQGRRGCTSLLVTSPSKP